MMTGIKLDYMEDLGSTVYSASFWTLLIVAFSSDIGLILFPPSSGGLILQQGAQSVTDSHSFMQRVTNQKLRSVSSWLLIGLNLHERM